jgi:hypothetical protein
MAPPFPTILDSSDAVALGNRLHALKQSPGYGDLYRISDTLVKKAVSALVEYPGWDQQQIAILKSRAQAATEHHAMLFSLVNEALVDASREADSHAEKEASRRTPREVVEEADELRAASLYAFDGLDEIIQDSRPAGSF